MCFFFSCYFFRKNIDARKILARLSSGGALKLKNTQNGVSVPQSYKIIKWDQWKIPINLCKTCTPSGTERMSDGRNRKKALYLCLTKSEVLYPLSPPSSTASPPCYLPARAPASLRRPPCLAAPATMPSRAAPVPPPGPLTSDSPLLPLPGRLPALECKWRFLLGDLGWLSVLWRWLEVAR
jgi:hypothetical protein